MSSKAVVLPSNLPVGCRFSPTEEEVIGHYLRLKNLGMDSEVDPVIAEVDFCNWDPWELPDKSKIKSNDLVWWFFSLIDYKYLNSKRANRKTKTGYWKITGTEKKIKDRTTKSFIGWKRILVFHQGPYPGKGTHWVMHEYYTKPDDALPNQRAYVVCRMELKPDKKHQKAGTPDYEKGESSVQNASDHENSIASDATSVVHVHKQVTLESFLPPQNSPNSRLIEQTMNFVHDNEMQALFGSDESEEYITNFVNSLIVDPEENNCDISDLKASSKRSYHEHGPISSDTDNEGFNERVKRYRSLAIG